MTNQNTITVELPIEVDGTDVVRVPHIGSMRRNRWREIAANPGQFGYGGHDIVAPSVVEWIERDEWEPLDVPEVGRTIKATLRDGRVETFTVKSVSGSEFWAIVRSATEERYYLEVKPDERERDEFDITAWHYVDDKPALTLAEIADQLQTTVDQIREALE